MKIHLKNRRHAIPFVVEHCDENADVCDVKVNGSQTHGLRVDNLCCENIIELLQTFVILETTESLDSEFVT